MPQSAKRVVLVSRPVGEPKASDFRVEDYAVPTPGEGQVLLRTIWLSLDPYMRGRMSEGPSYAAPVPIGGVMEGGTVSEVIASNNPGFAKGDIVLSRAGWQSHALSDGKGLAKIDPKLGPVSTAVGVVLDFAGINPVKALYWTAVINGLLAPFLLVAILMVAADKKLMQGQPSSRLAFAVVAIVTVAMFAAGIAMFVM